MTHESSVKVVEFDAYENTLKVRFQRPVIEAGLWIGQQVELKWGDSLAEGTQLKREEKLEEMCQRILATLRVNLQRGTLTTEDDKEFSWMLDGWGERLRDL